MNETIGMFVEVYKIGGVPVLLIMVIFLLVWMMYKGQSPKSIDKSSLKAKCDHVQGMSKNIDAIMSNQSEFKGSLTDIQYMLKAIDSRVNDIWQHINK